MTKKAPVSLENESQALKEFGEYLYQLRTKRGLSLLKLGAHLGTHAGYLSQVERGLVPPHDELVQGIAEFFGLDENDLYEMLQIVPLSVRQEIEQNVLLQRTLREINQSFSQKRKQELYQEFYNVFQNAKK
ncbi:hypothetical protein SDC9_20792 [bioreactor metagenome]|uniref:HTH cro/C1-type domain-containing protein n=1 Tax=bioreactor metagenome TaxID=1076179 RepID=A0A644U7W7_9ZZZZ|nr:helix-turn-helix transcriptional regulator [Desulfitobacterium hafniense]MEA5024569.1 helix-turn-helix transcriptional regulator [Desulfitobacterium hafniense]